MDPKQLRETGELSDFTVYVGKQRFKLHKFPLYTKSEYFKEAATSSPVCELSDFPGGPKNFAIIADFCYGKDIELIPNNVVNLNFGAAILRMTGKENLLEITKNKLNEMFFDCSSTGNYLPLLFVICSAHSLKINAAVKTSDDALKLLQSSWLPNSSSYSERPSPRCVKEKLTHNIVSSEENVTVADYLVFLPLNFMTRLINEVGLDPPNGRAAYRLVHNYLARILDHWAAEKSATEKQNADDKSRVGTNDNEPSPTPKDKIEKKVIPPPMVCQQSTRVKPKDQAELENLYENDALLRESLSTPLEHFDKLFDIIPDENMLSEIVTNEWIKQTLLLIEDNQLRPKCRGKILKLAHQMLPKLAGDELSGLSPSTMIDILNAYEQPQHRPSQVNYASLSRRTSRRISGADRPTTVNEETTGSRRQSVDTGNAEDEAKQKTTKRLPSNMTRPVVKYMDTKTAQKSLTVPEFLKISARLTIADDDDQSSNDLVTVLQKLKQSGTEFTDEDKKEMLEIIDLSRCSPEVLAKALEQEILPAKPLAEAALTVASKQGQRKPKSRGRPETDIVPHSASVESAPCVSSPPDDHYRLGGLSSSSWRRPYDYRMAVAKGRSRSTSPTPITPATYSRWSGLSDTYPYVPRCRPISGMRNYPLYSSALRTLPRSSPPNYSTSNKYAVGDSNVERILDLFEEELRKELAKLPLRAHMRALQRSYSPDAL
ncbi:unnamed protein product [Calicophoron daubneyi]|uniref:BTB domain-containing protein n=1 Tax=Calicophoron daubneyi TaxID=300641 RepID=A0AAV2TIP4_CALDB